MELSVIIMIFLLLALLMSIPWSMERDKRKSAQSSSEMWRSIAERQEKRYDNIFGKQKEVTDTFAKALLDMVVAQLEPIFKKYGIEEQTINIDSNLIIQVEFTTPDGVDVLFTDNESACIVTDASALDKQNLVRLLTALETELFDILETINPEETE